MKTLTTAAAAISMAVVLTSAAATLTVASTAAISHSSPIAAAPVDAPAAASSTAGVRFAAGATQLDAAIHPDNPATPGVRLPGALNAFWIWLTGSVKPGMQIACQPPRYGTIYLRAGDYIWNLFLSADVERTVRIPLESGYYTWNDCIMPVPGRQQQHYNYNQFSILCPPNDNPRTPCVQLQYHQWIDSGTYFVGSSLTRLPK